MGKRYLTLSYLIMTPKNINPVTYFIVASCFFGTPRLFGSLEKNLQSEGSTYFDDSTEQDSYIEEEEKDSSFFLIGIVIICAILGTILYLTNSQNNNLNGEVDVSKNFIAVPNPNFNHQGTLNSVSTNQKKLPKKTLDYASFLKSHLNKTSEQQTVRTSLLTNFDYFKSENTFNPDYISKISANSKEDRCVGSMYGMGIGDSFGAPLEFVSIATKNKPKFSFDKHNRINYIGNVCNRFQLEQGQWTDDASMGLCIADSLIAEEGFNGINIRYNFFNWWFNGLNNPFGNNPRRLKKKDSNGNFFGITSVGLGSNISKSIFDFKKNKKEVFMPLGANNDSGNGSLMRLAPIPIFFYDHSEESLIEFAVKSSTTTHPGIIAAECCSLLSFLIYKSINRATDYNSDVKEWLNSVLNEFLSNIDTYKQYFLPKDKSKQYSEELICLKTLIQSNANENSREANWNWRNSRKKYKKLMLKAYKKRLQGQNNKYNGYPVDPCYWNSFSADALAASLNSVYNSNSFAHAIKNAVNLLGDADSIGSITGQIAGSIYGFRNLYDNHRHKFLFDEIYKWGYGKFGQRALLLMEKGKLNKQKTTHSVVKL